MDTFTTTSNGKSYNARSYGILHNAYLGLRNSLDNLYVFGTEIVDGKLVYELITMTNPIKIGSGLISKPYYIMTGLTVEDAMNNPAMDDIEISSDLDIPVFKL